jgi:tetratricopeptide (TPR) repeat protein
VTAAYTARSVAASRVWHDQETFWTATLACNPGSPIGWSMLADLHSERGDTARAAEEYGKALALREGTGFAFPEAHTKLAQIRERQGDREGAKEEYRKALEKKPRHFVALLNLGEMRLKEPGGAGEAIDLLERAAAADRTDFRPHANLSQAHALAGQPERALEAIATAIRLRPDIPDLWQVQAELLERAGLTAEASESRKRALLAQPKAPLPR